MPRRQMGQLSYLATRSKARWSVLLDRPLQLRRSCQCPLHLVLRSTTGCTSDELLRHPACANQVPLLGILLRVVLDGLIPNALLIQIYACGHRHVAQPKSRCARETAKLRSAKWQIPPAQVLPMYQSSLVHQCRYHPSHSQTPGEGCCSYKWLPAL